MHGPALASTPRELPEPRRSGYVWSRCWREGFSLDSQLLTSSRRAPTRCPDTVGAQLPPAPEKNPGRSLAAAWAAAVHHLGTRCAVCGATRAQVLDHDHLTGLVRGLLCRYCNTWVDGCLHLEGCGFATYLDDPPAAELMLLYPPHRKVMAREKYRGRRWCFDVVMAGGPSPGYGLQPVRDPDRRGWVVPAWVRGPAEAFPEFLEGQLPAWALK